MQARGALPTWKQEGLVLHLTGNTRRFQLAAQGIRRRIVTSNRLQTENLADIGIAFNHAVRHALERSALASQA